MDRNISCCGVVCPECEYFGESCDGCNEIKGKVFWLEYTGETVCSIYECCIEQKGLEHCGKCREFPCKRYDADDPTKSAEENEMARKKQMELLASLKT